MKLNWNFQRVAGGGGGRGRGKGYGYFLEHYSMLNAKIQLLDNCGKFDSYL